MRLLAALLLVSGCGGDDPDTRSDSERICEDVGKCPGIVMLTSVDECVSRLEQHAAGCLSCLADLPCAGYESLMRAERTECDLCAACC